MCNCEDRPCCGCGDDQGPTIGDDVSEFNGEMERPCPICGEAKCDGGCDHGPDTDGPDDSMDGDHASALASAGFGTDEDYGGGSHIEDQHLDGAGEE